MNTHRGNDLTIFDEVIQCVKAHDIHYNLDYTMLQILSRKQLVQLLTKYYQLNVLKPTLHSVPLIDGSIACENIRNGYLYDGDLVFVILKGIYGFKFPKRFLEIISRDLTSSFLFCQS
jgi:hypothetical protein